MPVKPKPEKRSPVYVHCQLCQHEWVPVYTPIEINAFLKALKAASCPMCGKSEHVFMGQVPAKKGAAADAV